MRLVKIEKISKTTGLACIQAQLLIVCCLSSGPSGAVEYSPEKDRGAVAVTAKKATQKINNHRLTYNPFVRPKMDVVRSVAGAREPQTTSLQGLELRATLVSTRSPMADINGKVITIGELVEGFGLVRVEEGRVVLLKAGKEVVLSMEKPDSGG